MEYRKFGNDYLVRFDKGEAMLEKLKEFCEKEDVRLASISGIGALDQVEVGVFDNKKMAYHCELKEGIFEISSCEGNVSTMDGQIYLHLHMVVANIQTGEIYAGHLTKARIGATGEIFVHKVDGQIDRKFSPEIGINLIKF